FDKYAQATGYADVTATITPRGNTLSGVTRGGTSIGSANYSYDSTSHVLTLKKEYLATLGTGAQVFTVEMSAGTNPTLTVTISDTTPQNSTVTPTTAVFDKYAQATGYADVTATITPRGNTLSDVKLGGTSIGGANYSYDSTSHVLTLKKEYLSTLGTGAQVFTVEMSAGTNPTLTVTISDTTPQNSTVTPTAAAFDKYAQATGYADVTATITPRGNTLSGVLLNGTSIGSANYSYDSTSHVLTLKKEYLATLGTGAQVFTVEMSAGTNPTLTVTISDTTPQNSTVTPTTAVFDKYAQASGYADVTATITPRGNTLSDVTLSGTSIGSA
ncbi:X2-like carbohydrate binding domain-containing protein, partial [Paenibacillus typhae]|uniref:X2-like carbohydrate binding domain-containing protein n=1 Tax=Paenibacillus typhae TaxID=1174501 RepID=UPI0039EE9899